MAQSTENDAGSPSAAGAASGAPSSPKEPIAALDVVLPGDDLTSRIFGRPPTGSDGGASGGKSKRSRPPKLGVGLRYDPETRTVAATAAGRLYHRPGTSTYLVLSNSRRYVPRVGDRVLGIVEETAGGEYYRLNIFGPHPALLHNLSFEGATKRNRPYLSPGALLYCRVASATGEMDPEVSCKVAGDGLADGGARRRDWMTDEGTYGELKGGTCVRVSLGLARELLLPGNAVLEALGKQGLAFEVAIGTNGLVWVHSERPEYTVLICNAIKNSEVMTPAQVRGMVASLIKTVRSGMLQD